MRIYNLLDEKLSFAEARTYHQISATVYGPDRHRSADLLRRGHMKTLLLAAAAVSLVFLAASATLSPAATAMPFAANGAPHYEWQYHYGKKSRFEGHWVLVR